ncbi:MAG TPA: fumarylacetoacetase [Streptosporangiaceae bacterium]
MVSQARTSWVPVLPDNHFPLQNLPYGVFRPTGKPPRVGVAIGEHVLDLAALADTGLLAESVPRRRFATTSLNAFMAAGPVAWAATRSRLTELLGDPRHRHEVEPHLIRQESAELLLPFEVADYVDFYSSRVHAATVGRVFRPGSPPLPRNWLHLPIGYHGRAGSVVVSGTPVIRPHGQRKPPGGEAPVFGPTERLDFEAEVGFVAGVPSRPGRPVPVAGFRDHVFGFVLVNDWSARDIQSFEYQPLGPFLGKSFATSVSPWVVPVAALEAARVPPPPQDADPLAYLRCPEPWGLDLALEIAINGQVISRPRFRSMYWTSPQQLAHATVNGAPLRTGDLFASGTVSGEGAGSRGCLLELSWDGAKPLTLPDGTARSYLLDGDVVRISATAPGVDGVKIGFGAVEGTVLPATS